MFGNQFVTLPAVLRDLDKYSLLRAIRSLAGMADGPLGGVEGDASRELSSAMPTVNAGPGASLLVPLGAPVADLRDLRTPSGARQGERRYAPTMLEAIRSRLVVERLGARVVTGLEHDLPTVSFGPGASWEFVDPPQPLPSDPTVETDLLSPCEVRAHVVVHRRTLMQTGPEGEAEIVADLAGALAAGIDAGALAGTGEDGQPTGLLHAEGVNEVELGPDGGHVTKSDLVRMVYLASRSDGGRGRQAFAASPAARSKLELTELSAGSGRALWTGPDRLIDYPAETAPIPETLEKGASGETLTALVFGDFEALTVGQFGPAVSLTIDPYTYDREGLIRIVASIFIDVMVRKPETKWSRIVDMRWQ